MRSHNKVQFYKTFTSEIGVIYEEKRMGLNEQEKEMAYISLRFNKNYDISSLKTNIIAKLVLDEIAFEQISTNPEVDIYSLPLEDACTLHFFNEEYSKKFIIASRNNRMSAEYNANNCLFIYKTILKEPIKNAGISEKIIDTETSYFDLLFE